MRLMLCLVAGNTISEPKRKKSFLFSLCLVCLEKTNEWNNIPYETRIRYKIRELENKRKSWYLSFFSLGDEVGSNFDIICKEEAREETTIGIPFSQFVKVAAMMGTDVSEWYIFQFKGWMDCHALLLNMKSWLRRAGGWGVRKEKENASKDLLFRASGEPQRVKMPQRTFSSFLYWTFESFEFDKSLHSTSLINAPLCVGSIWRWRKSSLLLFVENILSFSTFRYETQLGAWPGLDPPLSIQILRLTMSFVAATQ